MSGENIQEMKVQEITIQELLDNMSSARGKREVLKSAIKKGVIPSQEVISSVIQYCIEKNEFVCAGDIAKLIGDDKSAEYYRTAVDQMKRQEFKETTERFGRPFFTSFLPEFAANLGLIELAFELYEENNDFSAAIKLAKEKGLEDKAESLIERQIAVIEERGDFFAAVCSAEYYGKIEKAREIRQRQLADLISKGKHESAAEVADRLGQTDQALELYAKFSNRSAIAYAVKKGLAEEAKEISSLESKLLEQKKEYEGAALNAMFAGEIDRAQSLALVQLEIYKSVIQEYRSSRKIVNDRLENLRQSAIKEKGNFDDYFLNAERNSLEIQISDKLGRGAALAEKTGLYEQACEFVYELCGYMSAVELARKHQRPDLARRFIEKEIDELEGEGHYEMAADIARRFDLNERAKELYTKQVQEGVDRGWFKEAFNILNRHDSMTTDQENEIYVKAARHAESRGDISAAYDYAKRGNNEELQKTYRAILESQSSADSKITTEDLGNNRYRHTTTGGTTFESIGHDPVRLELFRRIRGIE